MTLKILSDPEVRDIKRRLWFGSSVQPLADEYAVTPGMIRHIRNGLHWPHVPWPASDPRTKEPLTGAMPADRAHKIKLERLAAMKELQTAAQEDLQRTIRRRLRKA